MTDSPDTPTPKELPDEVVTIQCDVSWADDLRAVVTDPPDTPTELVSLHGLLTAEHSLAPCGCGNFVNGCAKCNAQPECDSCADPSIPGSLDAARRGECDKSQRPCGHHCNHVWDGEPCHWCS